MAVDKSLSQHYAIQGGGPNYLGKQKMVKAPKKWQSSPDHEPAELAYITEKEKDILIDLDIYGSLNGKPNRGPSGIISLQGDLGGYSGGHDHGPDRSNDGGWSPSVSYSPPPPAHHQSETERMMAEATRMETERKAAEAKASAARSMSPTQRAIEQQKVDEAARVREILTRGGVEDRISKGAVHEIDPLTGKYNAEAIQKAAKTQARERALGIGEPLTTEEITSLPMSTRIADSVPTKDLGLKFPDTSGIKKGATDFAKSQAKKMVRNKVMKELGLAGINPFLGIASWLFGKFAPNKKAALQSKIAAATKNLTKPREINPLDEFGYKGNVYAKKPTVHKESDNLAQVVSGQTDVISKAVNQFKGTKVDDYLSNMVKNDLNRAVQFYAQMTPNIGKASQQEKDAYEILGFYLNEEAKKKKTMMASTGGRVDKALTGRSRDI